VPRPNYTLRRMTVALVVLVVAGTVAWLVHLAVASPPARSAGPPTTHRPTSTHGPSGATPTTAARSSAERGLAVTWSELPLVDTSRQLVRGGAVLAPSRSLPTWVWTPTAAGRYPLVVFAHGYGRTPLQYERFCSQLASAGYVVAAPSFPLEDPTRGYGLDRSDLADEAGDVSFVITSLESGATAGRLTPGAVAVVGHSDGADVALEVGYEQGTSDHRVGVVVADAPDPVTAPLSGSDPPLLLVQGTADTVVPYSASQTVFTQLPGPTWYVSLLGADHLPPIQGGTAWTPVLGDAVADFLDATVAGRGPGTSGLSAELAASPLARLATKG